MSEQSHDHTWAGSEQWQQPLETRTSFWASTGVWRRGVRLGVKEARKLLLPVISSEDPNGPQCAVSLGGAAASWSLGELTSTDFSGLGFLFSCIQVMITPLGCCAKFSDLTAKTEAVGLFLPSVSSLDPAKCLPCLFSLDIQ